VVTPLRKVAGLIVEDERPSETMSGELPRGKL
jgi:hypothetical protein